MTEPTTTTETKPETITSLEITRFRGIREGRLDDIAPLTILVGPNGCGKSTILDATFIAGAPDPGMAIGATWQRGLRSLAEPRWIVWRSGSGGDATVSLAASTQALHRVHIKSGSGFQVFCLPVDGGSGANQPATPWRMLDLNPVRGHPNVARRGEHLGGFPEVEVVDQITKNARPLDVLYTEAVELGQRARVSEIVRALVPNLASVEILSQSGRPILHLVFPDGSVPAVLSGDGVHALIRMTLELAGRTAGTLLLEEPELHLHPGAIYQTMQVVVAAVRRGMQIIMTTHSLELIDALLSLSNNEDLGRMALYRLRLDDGTLKSVRLNGEEISFSRMTIEDDLR